MIANLPFGNRLSIYLVLLAAEDLPTFPVVDRLLVAVKERVNVAREIDKLELRCRRDNSQKGWLQKAAKDMDLLLDDEELLVLFTSVDYQIVLMIIVQCSKYFLIIVKRRWKLKKWPI